MTHTLSILSSSPLAQTVAAITVAFLLGTVVGLERQWRQRNAGLRTTVLVAVGAAAFANLGMRLLGPEGASRVVSYVVSGIGFLGAGVILKDGTNILGLNTAATLWCSAAIGTFAGTGMPAEAAVVTGFVLAGNTLLRPLVSWINRRPISSVTTDAEYRIHVTCKPAAVSEVRDIVDEELSRASLPIREVETISASEAQIELAATLVPATIADSELDLVVATLESHASVISATWSIEITS